MFQMSPEQLGKVWDELRGAWRIFEESLERVGGSWWRFEEALKHIPNRSLITEVATE